MPAYRHIKEHRCIDLEEAATKTRKAPKPRQPKKVLAPEEKEKAERN